jgi:CRP-like cAMP-binding protein
MPRPLVASAIGNLLTTNDARLASWRGGSRLAYEKAALMLLPTGERLIRELTRLAQRFGRAKDDRWTMIHIRLLQDDLASLIVRSRANVSRAFTALKEQGLVDRIGSRILIARSMLT